MRSSGGTPASSARVARRSAVDDIDHIVGEAPCKMCDFPTGRSPGVKKGQLVGGTPGRIFQKGNKIIEGRHAGVRRIADCWACAKKGHRGD